MKPDNLAYLISVAREKMSRFIVSELQRHKIGKLVPSHGDILMALYQHGSLPMKDLVRMIRKDKSTVTPLVEKLINLGYVDKNQDEQDLRIKKIALTFKGRSLRPIFDEISEKLYQRIYKNISVEEGKTLRLLLEKIIAHW
jgi:DNA-binding MarR family transcriptional regulator